MTRAGDFELDADEIVAAAIVILQERGLDAVSMRNVAERLGVSPMPLYTRVGNKAALIDAVADHLLVDLAPAAGADEPWPEYAERWCRALRERLKRTPDSRLYLGAAREPYVATARGGAAQRRVVRRRRRAGVPVVDVGDRRVRGDGAGHERTADGCAA
jgi:TetR/AcrR family tetracycline transcriptional repressor